MALAGSFPALQPWLLPAATQALAHAARASRQGFSSKAGPAAAAATGSSGSSRSTSAAAAASTSAAAAKPAAAPAGAAAGGGASRPLNFNDTRAVYSQAKLSDLLRAYAVLSICKIDPVVRNAESMLRLSRRVLGDRITFAAVRETFFKQFCAGEDEEDIWPAIRFLQANGVRAIVDFAAEDDVESAPAQDAASGDAATPHAAPAGAATPAAGAAHVAAAAAAAAGALSRAQGVVGRVYRYEDEAACDRHVGVFKRAIDTAGTLPGPGFAAIKVTALGNPLLLERMSGALAQVRELFLKGDTDGDRTVDSREFGELYRQLLPGASDGAVERAFGTLDLERQGRVDIVDWTSRIPLKHFPDMAERIKQQGGARNALSKEYVSVALSEGEVELADAMLGRVAELARQAGDKGVRLMVDAEHTYFQPAIDHTAKALSRQYNVERPIIFNTYQAYLKGSYTLLMEDMERARRDGYRFGAKLVRGAYMNLERRRAAARGYESPIWDTLQDTHDNYNRCMRAVLREVKESGAELMIASHNQESIELAVKEMDRLGLKHSGGGVYFGQLLGMADALTFTLGQNGYDAFKYVPYGPISEVLPYLVRRAQENSAIVQGAAVARQMAMLRSEIGRRVVSLGRA